MATSHDRSDIDASAPDSGTDTEGLVARISDAGRRAARATSRAVRGRRSQWARTPAYDLVQAELTEFSYELDARVGRHDVVDAAWAGSALRMVEEAQGLLLQGDIVEAGALLRAARRQTIYGDDRDAVTAAGERLLETCTDDLSASTADRLRLLQRPRGERLPRLATVRASVVEATREVDERALALDRGRRASARRLDRIALALAALLVLTMLGVSSVNPPAGSGQALRNLGNLAAVITAGALGAAVSLMLPWRPHAPPATEFLHATSLLLIRLAVGATAAVVVLIVLQSGGQGIVEADEPLAYAWALGAGFAERLVDRRLAD